MYISPLIQCGAPRCAVEVGEDTDNRWVILVQAGVTVAEHGEEGPDSHTDGFELFHGNVRRAVIVVSKTLSELHGAHSERRPIHIYRTNCRRASNNQFRQGG